MTPFRRRALRWTGGPTARDPTVVRPPAQLPAHVPRRQGSAPCREGSRPRHGEWSPAGRLRRTRTAGRPRHPRGLFVPVRPTWTARHRLSNPAPPARHDAQPGTHADNQMPPDQKRGAPGRPCHQGRSGAARRLPPQAPGVEPGPCPMRPQPVADRSGSTACAGRAGDAPSSRHRG